MCGEPDYVYSSLTSLQHKARKQHACCACDEPILPGHRYVRTFTTADRDWGDGKVEWYKHCLRCWSILAAVRAARPDASIAWKLNCGEDWKDTIGELPESVAALAFMSPEDAQRKIPGPI